MEKLTAHDEQLVQNFHTALGYIATLDDMFPPDSGVLAILHEPTPLLPPEAEQCIYELQVA